MSEYSYGDLKTHFYELFHTDKVNESKIIAKYYLKKAKLEKDDKQIAEGYVLNHFSQDLPIALKYIDSIKVLAKNWDKKVYPARIYMLKGNLYFKFDNLKFAFENYLLGLKYAKENNNERQIAFTEINIAYLNNYIGKYAEAEKVFKFYLAHPTKLKEPEVAEIRQNLVNAYLKTNKLDSAKTLIDNGLKYTSKNKDVYNYHMYLFFKGAYYFKSGKYNESIKELKTCEKFFSINPNDLNMCSVFFILGKDYIALNKKDIAVQYYTKIDSIIAKRSNLFPELREIYTFLIDYYKETNDKEKQLYYIEKFLTIDRKLDAQFKYLTFEMPKKYDIPKFAKEKDNIIDDLKSRKMYLNLFLVLSIILVLFLTYLFYQSKKAEKKQKQIAHDLIVSIEKNNESKFVITGENNINVPIHNITQEKIDKAPKSLPEETIGFILKELENFETKEYFLKKGITLNSLAKTIKTNSTYLSDVINTHKGKNFATYLNDLRIDYALKRLVRDKKFRSYKLSVIADELGYNNEQAFSLAFKKKTSTTLTIYLKEIDKANT
ncbi:helix-turn-helix domain-containing protein [Chryseobacterium sp. FH2]|uniref:helix-turn-helix domain-containing protein n=1 Tax=Chryseobacterium sp. FH2 TaxID=1674291 RepID=UPI0013F44DDE|nr:helix-turn-helix domain-containing protein [Chryseobacterium sp. FH2]